MSYKEILNLIAMALTLVAFLPYILSTIKGKTRPHIFSWLIWAITTFIVFLAQLEGGGGVGAWSIGFSGVITFFIAFLAWLKRADTTSTKTDWAFFIAAISSLPLWYFTSDPMWVVIILTTVDVLGFGPTVRKSYQHPYSESVLFYALFTFRNIFAIMALENYSLTTVLFPAVISLACVLLIAMILQRRAAV